MGDGGWGMGDGGWGMVGRGLEGAEKFRARSALEVASALEDGSVLNELTG